MKITRAIIDIHRLITLYSIGIFLSVSIQVPISHRFSAAEKISSCFQYIASTIFFAQIIIRMETALRQIIHTAFF